MGTWSQLPSPADARSQSGVPSSPVSADGRVQVGTGWASSLGGVSLDVSPRVGLDEEQPAEDGWMDDG